tara:strand:- start:5198 stop:5569 length:372 start_codon:yes stop_codon:yes gene_type:complete
MGFFSKLGIKAIGSIGKRIGLKGFGAGIKRLGKKAFQVGAKKVVEHNIKGKIKDELGKQAIKFGTKQVGDFQKGEGMFKSKRRQIEKVKDIIKDTGNDPMVKSSIRHIKDANPNMFSGISGRY